MITFEARAPRRPQERRRGPLQRVVDLFSSVWFGITLMALLFLYSTIMSAGLVYPTGPRLWSSASWIYTQPRIALDLTEMEAFCWWPFNLLLALFCLNLIVVTFRRIRFSWVNLGVWTIHLGILMLVAGSVYYFSTKVEGDTPVYRRQVEIQVPGESELVRLPVVPGSEVAIGPYGFTIQNIDPNWSLRSGADTGTTCYSVTVGVRTPTQTFLRQLLAGYPQYTEDVLPGQGRAVKALGQALVDEALQMRLAYLPQDEFYIADTAALYARPAGAIEWQEYPLDDLPHYQDHVGDRSWVWQAAGEPALRVRPLDLPVRTAAEAGAPLAGVDVRVTGFLRYAPEMLTRFNSGGDRPYPVAGITLAGEDGDVRSYQLAAFEPRHASTENGIVEFRWVESVEELRRLESAAAAMLHIEVPGQNIVIDAPITKVIAREPDLPFTPIEGSAYAYRVRGVVDDLVVEQGRFAGRPVSVARVELRTPERAWERWVSDPPEATRDVSGAHEQVEFDSGIVMQYTPAQRRAPLTLVAGPADVGIHLLGDTPALAGQQRTLAEGESVSVAPGLSLKLDYLYAQAVGETRPFVTPVNLRQQNAGATFSRIRVELRRGDWSRVLWMPYNAYALPDRTYVYPGRIGYQSEWVELPGGRRVELLFSRERMALGTEVALDAFELPTHAGGYTGQAATVRDYISRVTFHDGEQWSPLQTVKNNQPTEHAGWWYFQAFWDPPEGVGSGGMNYTGLGVGNRRGVYVQLAGTVIAVLGMLYAFYVKPILKRRRRDAALLQVRADLEVEEPSDERARDPVWAAVP